MAANDVLVKIKGDNRDLNQKLGQSKGAVSSWSSSVSKLLATVGTVLVVRKLAQFTSKAVELARTQAVEEAKLAAVIKATGGAAGFTADQMQGYASELQETIGIGDEVILKTQSIIATFKNIKGDQFKEATKAAFDLAAVLGTDASSGAIQLGKALNDPLKGISALSRAGVQFTREQEQSIKTFVEQNDIMSAQKIILGELQSQFGGTAEAIDKANGPWNNLANSIGDTAESIGRALIPVIDLTAVALDNANKAIQKIIANSAAEKLGKQNSLNERLAANLANDPRFRVTGAGAAGGGAAGAGAAGGNFAFGAGGLDTSGILAGLFGANPMAGVPQGINPVPPQLDNRLREFSEAFGKVSEKQVEAAKVAERSTSAGAFVGLEDLRKRISEAAGRADDPQKKIEEHTKDTAKHTKEVAEQMSQLANSAFFGVFQ